jgi:hypothetical protein
MQQACHKMEIGGVANRRLRLVRHQFDAVCLHQANIDRAAAGYSPDRVDALVWAFSELLVDPTKGEGIFEFLPPVRRSRRAAQHATTWSNRAQPGSMEWLDAQEKKCPRSSPSRVRRQEGELQTLPVIRLWRKDQQASTHVSLTSSACDRSICPSESSRQPKNL